MFGNTNRGPQGLILDSVRGELPGRSGACSGKIHPIVMELIKNMDPDALEGLRQSLNYGPHNSARTAPAAAKTSTQYTEQQRVKHLESMRTPENSHFIDEALASGEMPEPVALRIVKASLDEQQAIDEIVAEMNRLTRK